MAKATPGSSTLQSARDTHAAQLDAVIAALKAKLITPAEAENRMRSINETFDQAVSVAWKVEVIDNSIAALSAVKDLAKTWADGLLFGSGELADRYYTAIGNTGIFTYEWEVR